jgi:hypothetical protein
MSKNLSVVAHMSNLTTWERGDEKDQLVKIPS